MATRPFPFLLTALLMMAMLATGGVAMAQAQIQGQAVRDLHALFDSAWQRDLEEDPVNASALGDRRYNDRWQDLSTAAIERRHRSDQQVLHDLASIPRASLPAGEQLNYDLFEHEYRDRVEAFPFKGYLYPSQRGGIQTANETVEILSLQTVKDYEDWIARLRKLDVLVDQNIALLETAIKERRTQPKIIMQRLPAQIANQVVANPEHSPFYSAFKTLPDTIPAAERTRLQTEARRAINEAVVPAYRRLQQFFNTRYLPACRDTVGIWDTPDGAAYYRNRVAYFTTTNLSPDEVHELGLKEIARIRAEMDRIIVQVGFKGSFKEFLTYLRTDPRFYYKTSKELLEAYTALAKRIDPELVRLFGKLPRTPYGVRAIPMTSAPDTTAAYYQPPAIDGSRAGYFYANTYKPEARPTYEMEVLTAHEGVPGHHLQIALAMEQGELPLFRRNAGYTAYIEGWGLYSESLGGELGLYRDPYSKFGQLTYEMWRAIRLVVDTGLHHKRWTRQQAIDFFTANAGKTETDIVNEIDRYISWPGQALAYKIGELKIKELRTEAQQKLGQRRFDIREFHDTVLSTGAVPLDVLENTVHGWMEKKLKE